MANSSIIATLKKNVINAMCDDPDIDSMIDSPKYSGRDLKNTHIFTFNKNPHTITEVCTFITVMVSIRVRDKNATFVTPTLTITLYSHYDHMDLPSSASKKKWDYNRNDYLSMLIDEKFNDTTEYGGIGKLRLIGNEEYVATDEFLCRRLTFDTIDINDSFCDRWD